MIDSLFDQ